MLKLNPQYFGHFMRRVDSLKKIVMLGGIGGRGRRGRQKMRWQDASLTRWTWVSVNSGSWWWTGRPDVLQFMGSQKVRYDWATELNRTEICLWSHCSRKQASSLSPHWCTDLLTAQDKDLYMCLCMLSCFSPILLFVTLWIVAHQAPPSMDFSRQEYRSGLSCSPPGDLPNSRTEPMSLMSPALAGKFFTTSATWEAQGPVLRLLIAPIMTSNLLFSFKPYLALLTKVFMFLNQTFPGLCHE